MRIFKALFTLTLFSALALEREEILKYKFDHQTQTLTFYDVIPTKQEVEAVTYCALKNRFLACRDVFIEYSIKIERKKLKYEYDQKNKTHRLTDCNVYDINKLIQLPHPFNVLYFPRDRTVLSADEIKQLAPHRIAFTYALESIEDAEIEVQRQMYQDILKELKVDPLSAFYYTKFILTRWYVSKGITKETFTRLSALSKYLHFPNLATCSSDNPFKLTEEERMGLWQLQLDRILYGQVAADVAFIGTLSCPWIHPVIGRTYITKRAIKIGKCYSKTCHQQLYKDYVIDDDIIIAFRKSKYKDADKFYKDMNWWNWFTYTVAWGVEM